MSLYEKDNDDRLPYAFIRHDGSHFTSWDMLVFPYIKPDGYNPAKDRAPKGVLSCPSDTLASPDGERRRTYSMPAHSMRKSDWPPGPENNTSVGLWWQNGKSAEMATLEALAKATRKPEDGEQKAKQPDDVAWNPIGADAGSPKGQASMGRLPAVCASMLTAPAQTLLLTEQVRSNNIAFSWSGATIRDPNGHFDKTAFKPEQIHGGKFNYLVADGHVESLLPAQSIGKSERVLDPLAPVGPNGNEKLPNIWTIRASD